MDKGKKKEEVLCTKVNVEKTSLFLLHIFSATVGFLHLVAVSAHLSAVTE